MKSLDFSYGDPSSEASQHGRIGHGEPEAELHLGLAYHRGDHSFSTKFMFARALQPKLAVQARFASSFGRVLSATFSPDGRQIVTTDDRAAQVRDA